MNGLLTRRVYNIARHDGTFDCQVIVRNDRQTFLATKLSTVHIERTEAHYVLFVARKQDANITRKDAY